MTRNTKTIFLFAFVSILLPILAAVITGIFLHLGFAFIYFFFSGMFVIVPGFFSTLLFIFGVKLGEGRMFGKRRQWPYWLAILVLIIISLVLPNIYLSMTESRVLGFLEALLFASPVIAFGYPEGRICALREKAKWVSILPTAVISLFLSTYLYIDLIYHPPFA